MDLLRFRAEAPGNVIELLLLRLMAWAREHGFERLNLGMAPVAGAQLSSEAPHWTRVGSWVFRRGEALQRQQRLLRYGRLFEASWEARYVAYPGGIPLHRVLGDISALVAGGYRDIFAREARG